MATGLTEPAGVRNLYEIKRVDGALFIQLLDLIEQQITRSVLPEGVAPDDVKSEVLQLINEAHPKTKAFIEGLTSMGQRRLIELGTYRLLVDYIASVEAAGVTINSPEKVVRSAVGPRPRPIKPAIKEVKEPTEAQGGGNPSPLSVSFPDVVDNSSRLLRKPLKPREKAMAAHWNQLEKARTGKMRMLEFLSHPQTQEQVVGFCRENLKGRLDKIEKFMVQMARGIYAHRGWVCRTSQDGLTVVVERLTEEQVNSFIEKSGG